jgi:hypothetical protein
MAPLSLLILLAFPAFAKLSSDEASHQLSRVLQKLERTTAVDPVDARNAGDEAYDGTSDNDCLEINDPDCNEDDDGLDDGAASVDPHLIKVAQVNTIPPPPAINEHRKPSDKMVIGGSGILGAMQGWGAAQILGAIAGAGVAVLAAWQFTKHDYGGAFGLSAGAVIGSLLGGPVGAVIGGAIGDAVGHFLGKKFL